MCSDLKLSARLRCCSRRPRHTEHRTPPSNPPHTQTHRPPRRASSRLFQLSCLVAVALSIKSSHGHHVRASEQVHPVAPFDALLGRPAMWGRSNSIGGLHARLLNVRAFVSWRLLLGASWLALPRRPQRRTCGKGSPSVGPAPRCLNHTKLGYRCTDHPHPFKTHLDEGQAGAAAGQGQPTGYSRLRRAFPPLAKAPTLAIATSRA